MKADLGSVAAEFRPLNGTRTLVVEWASATQDRARVVVVPAFGDEMNQMRRMVSRCAQALAARGVSTCVFDLFGTGDSVGEFEDATVERWVADCAAMIDACAGASPLFLIGCRLGFALAAAASNGRRSLVDGMVGWAPMTTGKAQLAGLLRAAAIARSQTERSGNDTDPKTRWARGETAWLAGYPVSAAMARGLESLDVSDAPRARRIAVFDVRLPIDTSRLEVAQPLAKRVRSWLDQGAQAEASAIAGPAFWNVSDLVDVEALVGNTVDLVERWLR